MTEIPKNKFQHTCQLRLIKKGNKKIAEANLANLLKFSTMFRPAY